MFHINQEELTELAARLYDDSEPEEQDYEKLQHCSQCSKCEKRLAFCIDVLNYLQPQKMKEQYLERLRNTSVLLEQDISQDVSASKVCFGNSPEAALAESGILYRIKFVTDRIQRRIDYVVEQLKSGYPCFEAPYEMAFARGESEDMVQLAAELSVISLDPEEGTLTISLDEDIFGEVELSVRLEFPDDSDVLEEKLESDGYGMLEAVFELQNEFMETCILSIIER